MSNQLIDEITKINVQKQASSQEATRHAETQLSATNIQETIVHAFQIAINYLEGHVGKQEIVNLPETIGTPDIAEAVSAINHMHQTLKTHENTDVSEIVSVMREVLDQAKAIPKEHPELPDQQFVDYTDLLKDIEKTLQQITDAVKAQETTVEAPQVHVPAPNVHVDAPDLSSLETAQKAVVAAVKGITIPEPASNKEIEKLIRKTNSLLNEFLETPHGGGGGGGGLATPYQDEAGNPLFPQLRDGALPVTTDVAYDYTGMTNQDANGNYQTIQFKDGGAAGNVVKTLSLTYDSSNNVTSITRT
jgi:hypothetical protein